MRLKTTPKFSELPEGWLDENLKPGLDERHLYPDSK
jgi:hypothetical protein